MVRCLICGSTPHPLFSSRDHSRPKVTTEFQVVWCDACQFGRIAGDFSPEQIAEFYPTTYYTHSSTTPDPGPWSFAEKVLVHLAWCTDRGVNFGPSEVTGTSVCDIGCGNGYNLRQLSAAGFTKRVGIEPDEAARLQAKDAGVIFPGTAEDLPITGKFDVVLMSHSLEHCSDPIKAVSNARSLMADDGTLVIEVPNNAALGFRWFKGRWLWTDVPRHLSFFTEHSLRALFSKLDLELTKTIYLGYCRQLDPRWRAHTPEFKSGWPLLAATAFAPASRRYDSIRVHAKMKS